MTPESVRAIDEELRQSVIRKALLLGFSCEEYTHPTYDKSSCYSDRRMYSFMFDGRSRDAYVSIYAAAYDYLRLMKVPHDVIGVYRG